MKQCPLCKQKHKYVKDNIFIVQSHGTCGYIYVNKCIIGKTVKLVVLNEDKH